MTSLVSRFTQLGSALRSTLAGFRSTRPAGLLRAGAAAMLLLQPSLLPAISPSPTRILTVQVLDANSGHPVNPGAVTVGCRIGLDDCRTFHVLHDSNAALNGELRLEVPVQATALVIQSAASSVQQCATFDDTAAVVAVSSVASEGLVAANECHTLPLRKLQQLTAQPGRLVVFIHHKATCKRQLPFC